MAVSQSLSPLPMRMSQLSRCATFQRLFSFCHPGLHSALQCVICGRLDRSTASCLIWKKLISISASSLLWRWFGLFLLEMPKRTIIWLRECHPFSDITAHYGAPEYVEMHAMTKVEQPLY